MSRPDLPRVTVTLPGGRQVTGRLVRWQRAEDGQWRAHVALDVPAGAVERIPGEDYGQVPREPAPSEEPPRYVLAVDTRTAPRARRAELHAENCWTLGESAAWLRTTTLDAHKARAMLRIDDTTACDVCRPKP